MHRGGHNSDERRYFPASEFSKIIRWRWKIIKGVIENNIQVFNPENYDKEKFIYIDISSVDNVSKKILNTNQVLVKEAPSRAKSILKENDIIISTVRPNLNTVALVDKSRAGNICSSDFCVSPENIQ
jgi:type I restriction enzyme S subunit